MSDFYNATCHISQKERQCFGCGIKTETNPIKKGDAYFACRMIGENGFFAYSLCGPCNAWLTSHDGIDWLSMKDGSWAEGELGEARTHDSIRD